MCLTSQVVHKLYVHQKGKVRIPWSTHMKNDSFLQQTLLLCSHHKVVRVILVVDDVFQVNS